MKLNKKILICLVVFFVVIILLLPVDTKTKPRKVAWEFAECINKAEWDNLKEYAVFTSKDKNNNKFTLGKPQVEFAEWLKRFVDEESDFGSAQAMLGKIKSMQIANKFDSNGNSISVNRMRAFASTIGHIVLVETQTGKWSVLGCYQNNQIPNTEKSEVKVVLWDNKPFVAYEDGKVYVLENNKVVQWAESLVQEEKPAPVAEPAPVPIFAHVSRFGEIAKRRRVPA